VLLILLPLAGAVKALGRWLPTSLMRAPAGLLTGTTATWYGPAVAVSVIATVALLALATVRSRAAAGKGSARPT
jgi:hypothetical protein